MMTADVNDFVERGEQKHAKTAGIERHAGGPNALDNRHGETEAQAEHNKQQTERQQTQTDTATVGKIASLADDVASQSAKQNRHAKGEGGKKPSVGRVTLKPAQHGSIHARREITL